MRDAALRECLWLQGRGAICRQIAGEDELSVSRTAVGKGRVTMPDLGLVGLAYWGMVKGERVRERALVGRGLGG